VWYVPVPHTIKIIRHGRLPLATCKEDGSMLMIKSDVVLCTASLFIISIETNVILAI
jgi:hypothetical protein